VGFEGAGTTTGDSRLRTEPVQARSAARLEALLDAAAAVVDEVGSERLTTAMVAERAGASIGTVYRYFPDRVAVLEGLAARALSRFLARIEAETLRTGSTDLDSRVALVVDTLVEFHRDEPGYRVLRFGDLGATRSGTTEPVDALLVRSLRGTLGTADPATDAADMAFRLRVALAVCEVLIHRAFETGADPDARFVDEAKRIAAEYLATHVVAVD
jgi:AcrR family transcriptional regulator